MHNAIAHHSPSDAQSVPKQWPLVCFPSSLYTEHDIMWYGYFFGQLG